MIAGLEARLAEIKAQGQTIGYGDLARRLDIPGPGAIARLTAALEALMDEDARSGRPLRAALCCGRLTGGLPAVGFFRKAAELGRDVSDPEGFVAAERAALFKTQF